MIRTRVHKGSPGAQRRWKRKKESSDLVIGLTLIKVSAAMQCKEGLKKGKEGEKNFFFLFSIFRAFGTMHFFSELESRAISWLPRRVKTLPQLTGLALSLTKIIFVFPSLSPWECARLRVTYFWERPGLAFSRRVVPRVVNVLSDSSWNCLAGVVAGGTYKLLALFMTNNFCKRSYERPCDFEVPVFS